MLSRLIRAQLLVFLVISVVGVVYVGANYVNVGRLIWDSGYTVAARFDKAGGLFVNSEVTYRGVPVGRVTDMRLTEQGMIAVLHIAPDAPRIPADVRAVVANRSVIGEEYVDLRPRSSGGPYLGADSVIENADTSIPLPVGVVLSNISDFAESVPKEALRTVVDELYEMTSGAGPHLETLLAEGIEVIDVASEHIPALTQLLTDAKRVLSTQAALSEEITSFAANAELLAETIKNSDQDLRKLLPTVPKAARAVTALVRDLDGALTPLLANLVTTAEVVRLRRDGLEQLLVTLPKVVAAGSRIIRPDGVHVGLVNTYFEPKPCVSGYGGTQYRNGLDTNPGPPLNTAARCTLPYGHPSSVRGAQNAPEPG